MNFFIKHFKSIIMSISKGIKNFLKNIWQLFEQFWKVAENKIKDNVHIAVVITENVKNFIDNPIGDFLLSVVDDKIPGDVSEKVKEVLPKVLLALHIIDDCKDKPQEETLKCISEKLFLMADEVKDVVYHSLAVKLAEALSDGHISFAESITLVQWYYTTQIKK